MVSVDPAAPGTPAVPGTPAIPSTPAAPGTPDLRLVGRAHRGLEPLHSHVYLAPETADRLVAVGLRPGRMLYFAGRAAPMGAVGPAVVAATFYNYAPSQVARYLPRAWALAGPAQVVAARSDAARASLTRLLDGSDAADTAELAGLVREATTALTPEGRALYAGHADQPWPEDPVLQLWHGVTLLREHRGDGHVASLLRHGLGGIEALVTHTLGGGGQTRAVAQASRGWSDEEWTAAVDRLTARGLVAGGTLTDAGTALRAAVEEETDVLSAAPFAHLGTEATGRVVELAGVLTGWLARNQPRPDGAITSHG